LGRPLGRPGEIEDKVEGDSEKNSDLSSLFQNRLSSLGTPATAAAAEAAPATLDSSLDIENLVDRILVSDPVTSARNEVRLSLNDSAIADTEVILSRGADGLLSVSFSTANASSMQTLVAAQSALKEALERVENREVRLEINNDRDSADNNHSASGRGTSGDDDSGHRSRGYDYLDPTGGQ
jgi:type III secretion system needle length determinant